MSVGAVVVMVVVVVVVVVVMTFQTITILYGLQRHIMPCKSVIVLYHLKSLNCSKGISVLILYRAVFVIFETEFHTQMYAVKNYGKIASVA